MLRNVASQKVILFAFIPSSGAPKTGDAANLTAYVSKDYGTVTALTDSSATEFDATNAKGMYAFDLTQAETSADVLMFTGKSSTSDVSIVPVVIYTRPPNASLLSIDSAGRMDVIKVAGTTQTARNLGASVLIESGTGTGQLSVTSGVVAANATQIAGVAVSTSTAQLGVNVVQAGATVWGSGAITAGAIAADAITAAKIADGAIDRATFAADTGLQTIRTSTATAGAATSVTLDAGASSVTNFYKYALLYIVSGTGAGQGQFCSAYNGTTKVADVPVAWATNPASGSVIAVIAFGLIPGATGLDAAATRAALGLATNNLDTQLTAINAKTTNLPSDPADASDVAAQITAALTAAVADSIPADGSRPSIAQGIYMLVQFMLERQVSGQTMSVMKPNGTTALYTMLLGDASEPQTVTRAT